MVTQETLDRIAGEWFGCDGEAMSDLQALCDLAEAVLVARDSLEWAVIALDRRGVPADAENVRSILALIPEGGPAEEDS